MRKLQKSLLWFCLTCKRLLKKPGFLILLCSIPVLVLSMGLVAKEESGMLHIVLYQENEKDLLSSQLVEDLLSENSVLQYQQVFDEEEAYELVENGNADAAWIFSDKMQERLEEYIAGAYDRPFIRILEREDNVALQLSREKLYGALYSYFPYTVYEKYVQNELGGDTLSGEELRTYYESARVEGDLFQLTLLNGEVKENNPAEGNYLTAPVRGLLALVIMLCGLSAVMYYLQDEAAGVFDRVALKNRQKYLYGYELAAMLCAGIAVFVALALSGDFEGWLKETGLMILYLVMSVGFCSVVKKLCGNLQRLGTCIPLLMIGMLILCPVFFAVRRFRMLQYLLPPFYYLNAVHNHTIVPWMCLYCLVILAVDFALDKAMNMHKS